jgi:hypothetical protein
LVDEVVVAAADGSTDGLDSMLELLELKVGCTSLLGTPPDEGRCPKFWPRDPVLRAEVDEVGNTISSLLGKPTEGC